MALTPASILADYSSGIGTQGATLQIKTEDQRVGIGTTNPQGTLQVGTAITMGSGIVTATAADLSGSVTASTASFSGNVSVGGVLTYEDVTSVDSVGIITARSNVLVGGGLSVTGISTFNGITTSTTTIFSKDFSVSGVSTLGGNVVVGGATTELVVRGDARVTGILTVGTASLTLNGTTGAITGGSLTNAQVAAISTSIVGTGTTVDVFVYDTSKDSDGGAWRKRTQHTSWYNESLNGPSRGTRREFPAVAVIVAETDKVTIYDGDDPDLPMWMVFNVSSSSDSTMLAYNGTSPTSLYMKNGILCVTFNTGGWGISEIRFVDDSQRWIWGNYPYPDHGQIANTIAERNVESSWSGPGATGGGIVVGYANDVAMTVLPNAPIDDSTGLPVPTIAVATGGGVSVIKDDGTVYDTVATTGGYVISRKVEFEGEYLHIIQDPTLIYTYKISAFNQDYSGGTLTGYTGLSFYSGWVSDSGAASATKLTVKDDSTINIGHPNTGLSRLYPDYTYSSNSLDTASGRMVSIATTPYNTGWMHGDTKGAFLSDTDTTNVTGSDFITNGNFDDTDISYWTAANGATLTHQTNGNPGGNINVASGPSSNGYASRSHTVVVGKYYTLSFDHYHVDGSQGYVNIGTSTGGSEYIYQNLGTSSSWTTYSFTIKATSTNLFTGFYSRPNGNVRYDNIVLREADPDRSVNKKGLQVFGTVTKSAVATGADLVGYSGFSNNTNYLKQPYNSDMDFGTSDFSVTWWMKYNTITTGSIGQYVYDRKGTSANRSAIYIWADNSGSLAFYTFDGSASELTFTGLDSICGGNKWACFTATRHSSGLMEVYADGELKASNKYTVRNLTSTDAEFFVGIRYSLGAGEAVDPDYALLRFSKTIPSAEQIKKMYNDEKRLFEGNAKCTLYGTSDAVTALGYDDDEDTLYVGTSSGRSDFRGLRRINNTTTAVTTAISASNGLVAEE